MLIRIREKFKSAGLATGIVLAGLLVSCTDGEIKPFEEYEYNVEVTKIEGEEAFDVKCFKRKYRIWKDRVGSMERFKEASVSECSKIFGFKPEAKGKWWALLEYVRKEIELNPHETIENLLPGNAEK